MIVIRLRVFSATLILSWVLFPASSVPFFFFLSIELYKSIDSKAHYLTKQKSFWQSVDDTIPSFGC